MSEKETGGSAFPRDYLATDPEDRGMTLRDYFAAKAMQALIEHHGDVMHIVDADGRTSLHFAAYDHADAMLEARQ